MPVTPLKGALARINRRGTLTQRFDFILNPEQLHRRLHWPESGETANGTTPCERLSFKLVLDASDALERPDENPTVLEHGLRPQLALLRSFLQPADARSGGVRPGRSPAGQPLVPALVFLWGQEPAVPVWMVSLNVREELFDSRLNPLRASAWVELEVLPPNTGGKSVFANLSNASRSRMHELVKLISKRGRVRRGAAKANMAGKKSRLATRPFARKQPSS